MINTNTNRWQSVRLLFDKHIIGGKLKPNYQWQQSAMDSGGRRAFAASSNCCGLLSCSLLTSFMWARLKDHRQDSGETVHQVFALFKWAVTVVGSHRTNSTCSIIASRVDRWRIVPWYVPANDHTINYQLESLPSFKFTPLASGIIH